MSSIKVTNLLQASSATNNLVLTSGGDVQVTNNLQFNSGYGSVATAYGCRAWVNFNGTTASPSTIRGSGNVSSVTKNGTGDYTVNFATAMVDVNYSWAVNGHRGDSAGQTGGFSLAYATASNAYTSAATGSLRIITQGTVGNAGLDWPAVTLSIFR